MTLCMFVIAVVGLDVKKTFRKPNALTPRNDARPIAP